MDLEEGVLEERVQENPIGLDSGELKLQVEPGPSLNLNLQDPSATEVTHTSLMVPLVEEDGMVEELDILEV